MTGRLRPLGMAIAATVAAIGGGCVSAQTTPVTVEVWYHETVGPGRAALEHALEAFNEERSDITVLLRVLPEGSSASAIADALASGEGPDLLDVDSALLAQLVDADLLDTVTGLAGTAESEVDPAILTELGAWSDRAVPAAADVSALVVDVELLRSLEVRLPTSADRGWSIDEFDAIVEQVAHSSERVVPLGLIDDLALSDAALLVPLLWSAGAGLTPPVDAPVGLDSADAASALVRIGRWYHDGRLSDVTEEALASGAVAMALTGSATAARMAAAGSHRVVPAPDLGLGAHSVRSLYTWVRPVPAATATTEDGGDRTDSRRQRIIGDVFKFLISKPVRHEINAAAGLLDVDPGSSDDALAAALSGVVRPHPSVIDGRATAQWVDVLSALADGDDVSAAVSSAVG